MNYLIAKAKILKGKAINYWIKIKKRMHLFDIPYNLDTSDCVDIKDLIDSIDSENVENMGRYVPTNHKQLKPLLDELTAIDPTVLDYTLIDFGCGKGRVLIQAERMGFKDVIGIEFSKKLYDICLNNLKKVKAKAAKVVCEDATKFKMKGNIKTFYFCNPFEFCILEKVLMNIQEYIKTVPYDTYLIYIDPRKFGRLDENRYEMLVKYDGPLTPYHIYKVLK